MLLLMSVVTDTVVAGRNCFKQPSTDFVGSCGVVRMEGHDCCVHRVLFDFWYRECTIQLVTDKMCELCVLLSLLLYVLAVIGALTGYVFEVFVESVCNVFRFSDFLFNILDDGVLLHPVDIFHADAPTVAVTFWCSLR